MRNNWLALRWQQWLGGAALVYWTACYLALPLLFFLFGWLQLAYALPMAAMLVCLLLKLGRDIGGGERQHARLPLSTLLICGIAALLWTGLSGAGGIGLQNGDYLKHNAILKTLILFEWPAALAGERMLVYTIGYYLPAAAVGKLFGWAAANLALFAWTFTGVWLTLLWFVRLAEAPPFPRSLSPPGESSGNGLACLRFSRLAQCRALYLAPLFVLLSGMDIILWHFFHPEPLHWGRHLEWATGRWHFQFSSTTTLLFWTPQHALPGWLGAALFMHLRDSPAFHRGAALLLACLFLWSVFAALGVALLLLVWLALHPRHLRTALWPHAVWLQHLGGALLLLMPALYLLSNDFNFPSELYAKTMTELGLWPRYAAFIIGEYALVGICALLLMRLRGGGGLAGLFAALMAILACLHLYKVSGDPDLAMRASIPLLFVFWRIVCSSLHGDGRRRLSANAPAAKAPAAKTLAAKASAAGFSAAALKGVILAAVFIGAAAPYMEIHRSIAHYRMSPPPLAAVKDMDNFSDWPPHHDQYLGHRRSFFFRALAKPPPR